uniref:Uncharacterized protein n=1 Tax=Setaria viridis TaxID=4556 RepID=A0A4U6TCD2_SETVI|nr:hypothetical protein SEVIR_9G571050v2 [Setaria viridis]
MWNPPRRPPLPHFVCIFCVLAIVKPESSDERGLARSSAKI